jgi:hypothetical protein
MSMLSSSFGSRGGFKSFMCASSNVLSPFFTLHDEQAVTYNKENFSEKLGH